MKRWMTVLAALCSVSAAAQQPWQKMQMPKAGILCPKARRMPANSFPLTNLAVNPFV